MVETKRVIGAVVILCVLLGGCAGKRGKWGAKGGDPAALYRKGLEHYRKKRYGKALEVFNEVKGSFPGVDPYYPWAELKAADCYFFQKEYQQAITHYEEFKKFHPFHEDIPYVIFQIGLSYFNQILSVDRDQTFTRKALSNFEFLMANYPPSVLTEKAREKAGICRERLAAKELYVGKFHYKRKRYRGAKERLEAAVKLYPEADIRDEALFYLGESCLKLGERDAARRAFTDLVRGYPESEFSDKARKALSETLEEGGEGSGN